MGRHPGNLKAGQRGHSLFRIENVSFPFLPFPFSPQVVALDGLGDVGDL
jgi:hypothetical protein